jgi:hypothetical protein
MNRFQKHKEDIVNYDALFKDHHINVMQLPKLEQITLNTGIGIQASLDKKQILSALLGLEYLSNQRPKITRAKKSIDKFKLRKNMAIGCKVTLRKKHAYEFMDRFLNRVLPGMDTSHEIYNTAALNNYANAEKHSMKGTLTETPLAEQPSKRSKPSVEMQTNLQETENLDKKQELYTK